MTHNLRNEKCSQCRTWHKYDDFMRRGRKYKTCNDCSLRKIIRRGGHEIKNLNNLTIQCNRCKCWRLEIGYIRRDRRYKTCNHCSLKDIKKRGGTRIKNFKTNKYCVLCNKELKNRHEFMAHIRINIKHKKNINIFSKSYFFLPQDVKYIINNYIDKSKHDHALIKLHKILG